MEQFGYENYVCFWFGKLESKIYNMKNDVAEIYILYKKWQSVMNTLISGPFQVKPCPN